MVDMVLLAISLANISVLIIIQWSIYKNREYFPIKERSPYLTMLGTFGLYLAMEFQLIMYLWTGYKTIIDKKYTICFSGVGLQMYILCTLLKQLRLAYAFYSQITLLHGLIKREKLLVLLVFINCFLSVINFYYISKEDNPNFQIQNYYIQQFFITLSVVFILGTLYSIRNINWSYRLKEEGIYIVIMFSVLIGLNFYQISHHLQTPEYFKLQYSIYFLSYYGFLLMAIVRPLKNCSIYHIKPAPRIILRDFKLFIEEKECVKVFYQYLTHLDQTEQQDFCKQTHPFALIKLSYTSSDEKSEEIKNYIQRVKIRENDFHVNLFNFYCDVLQYMNQQQEIQDAYLEDIFRDYFDTNREQLTHSLQKSLSNKLSAKSNINNTDSMISTFVNFELPNSFEQFHEMIRNSDYAIPKQIIMEYHQMAREYLEFIFETRYVFTNSYNQLTNFIAYHEVSQFRLYQLGMTLFQLGILEYNQELENQI